VAIASLYLLHLLRVQPRADTLVVPEPVLELGHFGAALRGAAGQPAACTSLSWAEITRVDVVTTPAEIPSQGISFLLMTDALASGSPARQLLVPGAQAVTSELLDALTTHLGSMDQAQLLSAIMRQGEGRFTLWQRCAAQG
jgi:hypothetical protein